MKKAPAKRLLALFIACLMVVSTCLTITINADYEIVEWDYLDEGTGMPDPNDPTEGLPFPDLEGVDPIISEYYFTYKPTVYAYGTDGKVDMTTPVTSVKAGDVFWLKIACTDIEKDKLLEKYEGFYDFEGFYTYDVEAIDRYYGGKNVSLTPGKTGILDTTWFKKFINIDKLEGMADFEIEMNWANVFTPSIPPTPDFPTAINGMGQHFSFLVMGVEYGDFGIIEDEQFYFCVPLVIKADAEDGEEYTFTVPYPGLEQFADAYYWNDEDGYLYHDSVYGRGGAYTIVVDNHDSVAANLATNALYAIDYGYGDSYGEYVKGFLNDRRYPLTEKSDYDIFNLANSGVLSVDMKLEALSSVDSVVVTFNDTADADLPSSVEVYGIDAEGNEVFLGEAAEGSAYYTGVTDSTNYASTVTVNAANAYQYEISGFDSGRFTNIVVRAYGEGKIAMGEVEINGEAAKVSVTIKDGVIDGASSDNLYYPGDVLTITADELAHKSFTEWTTENGTGSFEDNNGVWTFTVGNSDEVIVANYEDVYYNLTVHNGIFDDGNTEGEFLYDSVVTIIADDAEENKVFDRWIVVGDAIVEDAENPETTITVHGNATVTATYRDTCMLAVTNGSGTGSYNPGATANISADAADEGYVFYKWEVVSGDVVIADEYSATTTAVVNTNAEVKATYVWAYKDVPENLVTENTPVTMEQGSVVGGNVDYTKDQLYPLLSDGNWLIATDSKGVVLSYDLGQAYDVSKVVLNFSKLQDYVLTDEVIIYGANDASLADKTQLVKFAVASTDTDLSFEDGINLVANSSLLNIDVNDTTGYRYIVIELSTDYYLNYPGLGIFQNSQIAIGEVEIYGEYARYDITVDGADISYEGSDDVTDGYLAGSEIILTPVVPEGCELEGWETTAGEVVYEDGEYKYVVEGDAEITAVYTEVNQPVPDNLAPNSSVQLVAGTLNSDAATGDYVNDQLYPMTSGAYWADYYGDNNEEIKFIFDLGDYYDITSGNVTVHAGDVLAQILMQEGVKFEGSNNADGSDAVLIGQIASGCLEPENYTVLEFADFGVDSALTSVAYRYEIKATNDVSCRYVIVTLSTEYQSLIDTYYPNPVLRLGEIEIYGTESEFKVTMGENGTIINPSEDDLYDDGDVIEITADEIPHKQFVGWVVDGEGEFANAEDANTTFTVGSSDATITAVYEDVLYGLVVENGTGDGEYAFGTTVTIVADQNADPEKVFDKWVVTGDAQVADVNNPNTTVITGTDSIVTATYKDRVYLLTVENGTGSGNYANATTVTITADAPAQHMEFSHWEIVTGDGVIADVNSATTTIITSNEATTVRAVYKDVLYDVTVNYGYVDPENLPEEGGYKVGSEVDIFANHPAAHKQFAGWKVVSGDCTIADPSSATTTLTVIGGDVVVEATYSDVEYTVTVIGGEGSGDYIYDANATIKFTPPAGALYVFNGWTVEEGEAVIADAAAEETTITVKGDATIKANYTVVYNVDVINGTVSEDDVADYYYSGEVITVIADEVPAGKYFAGWVIVEGNGTIEDASALTTTVTIGTSDLVIRAEYEPIMVELTVNNGNGSGSYALGSSAEISAVIPEGYIFTGWEVVSGDAVIADETAASTSVIVNSDAVVTANYVEVYNVEVINGSVDEESAKDYYLSGDVVNIVADPAEDGMRFAGWTVVEGDCTIENASAAVTTITVGSADVVIRAEFEEIPVEPETVYTLTVENGLGGGEYTEGTVVTITADIPEGYVFTGWTVTAGDVVIADVTAVETTLVLTGDATVTANYVEALYVDIVNGVIDGEEDYYLEGDVITIIADAAPEHMHFDKWVLVEGDAEIADINASTTTVTIGSGDVVIRAEYTDNLYDVTVENGVITNADEGGYVNGTVLNITADAPAEDYVFDKWIIVSGNGEFANENDANTAFTVDGDAVIRATYKVVSDTPATGDSGIAIFAILSVIAAGAAAIVVKKKSK